MNRPLQPFLRLLAALALWAAPVGLSAQPASTEAVGSGSAQTKDPPEVEESAGTAEALDAEEADAPPGSASARVREGGGAEGGSGLRISTICTNCNAATLSMNGLQGDHVRVTWDGLPVTGGLAAVFALTQWPDELLSHAEVNRGPGSVRTGDSGLGGSIDLHSIDHDEARLLVRSELGSEGWRRLLVGGTQPGARASGLFFAQGAASRAWDSNSDGYEDVADFERTSGLGLVDLRIGERQVLSLGGSHYREDQSEGPGAPVVREDSVVYLNEDVEIAWSEMRAGWRLEGPGGLVLRADLRGSRRDQVQRAPFDVGEPQQRTFDIDDRRILASFELEMPAGAAGFLSAGAAIEEITLGVDQLFHPPNGPSFIEDSLRHREAHVEWERGTRSGFELTLGARLDEYVTFGESDGPRSGFRSEPRARSTFLSPRARLAYRPGGSVVLSAALGRGTIGPRPAFEQTCCGARYQRSLDLSPERAWSAELRAEWRPAASQRIVVTTFGSRFDDYHERVVFQSEAGIVYWKKAALPRARLAGLDLIHDLRFLDGRLTVGWSYTFTDSRVSEALALADPAAAAEWGCRGAPTDPAAYPLVLDTRGGPLRYTPEHAARLGLALSLPERAGSVSLAASYTGSVRHFRIGTEGAPTLFAATTRAPCNPWAFLSSDSFWTVDASYEQQLGRSNWTVRAAVDNLFDYVMPDLGRVESSFDWGPLQGRFIRIGATWRR